MSHVSRRKVRGIIVSNNELLVVKHNAGDAYVALPGGHIEAGEEPQEALIRELHEELGCSAQVGRLLYENEFVDVRGREYFEYLFEVLNGDDFRTCDISLTSHGHELSSIVWLKRDDSIVLMPRRLQRDFSNNELPTSTVRIVDK